ERRFAMPWGPPAPRLREYVGLIRAVWDNWQDGAPLNFRGEHYRASLMTPFFNPGPIDHPRPPIYLAGVDPHLLRLTGEVANGTAAWPTASVCTSVSCLARTTPSGGKPCAPCAPEEVRHASRHRARDLRRHPDLRRCPRLPDQRRLRPVGHGPPADRARA